MFNKTALLGLVGLSLLIAGSYSAFADENNKDEIEHDSNSSPTSSFEKEIIDNTSNGELSIVFDDDLEQ